MSESEFRIEKIRRRVAVLMVYGERLEGDIFLQPSARYRSGPQYPDELFNEPEPFLPLAVGSDLRIIAKENVVRVQFAPDAADTGEQGVEDSVEVDVTFSAGDEASGRLRLETRAERPRLLDFLNDDHQRFLTLRSADGITLINRRQIASIRQRR